MYSVLLKKISTNQSRSDDSDEESANPNHLSRGILNQVCEVRYDDSDFDEEDDNIPLSVIRRNLPSTSSKESSSTASKHEVAPKRKKISWSEDIRLYNINQVCNPRRPLD